MKHRVRIQAPLRLERTPPRWRIFGNYTAFWGWRAAEIWRAVALRLMRKLRLSKGILSVVDHLVPWLARHNCMFLKSNKHNNYLSTHLPTENLNNHFKKMERTLAERYVLMPGYRKLSGKKYKFICTRKLCNITHFRKMGCQITEFWLLVYVNTHVVPWFCMPNLSKKMYHFKAM